MGITGQTHRLRDGEAWGPEQEKGLMGGARPYSLVSAGMSGNEMGRAAWASRRGSLGGLG